jgi:hypothetical protein
MSSEAAASIASMLVKLPEFWLKICFGQVEASFRQTGITVSATKYSYVLMKLSHKASISGGKFSLPSPGSPTPLSGSRPSWQLCSFRAFRPLFLHFTF